MSELDPVHRFVRYEAKDAETGVWVCGCEVVGPFTCRDGEVFETVAREAHSGHVRRARLAAERKRNR